MWFDEYEQLTHTEKEQFILTANQLLSKTFIIRDKYSPKEKRLKLNPDYRFIERHLEPVSYTHLDVYKRQIGRPEQRAVGGC